MPKLGKYSIGTVWPRKFDFQTMLRLTRNPYKVQDKRDKKK